MHGLSDLQRGPPRSSMYRADSCPEHIQEARIAMEMKSTASLPLFGTVHQLYFS